MPAARSATAGGGLVVGEEFLCAVAEGSQVQDDGGWRVGDGDKQRIIEGSTLTSSS